MGKDRPEGKGAKRPATRKKRRPAAVTLRAGGSEHPTLTSESAAKGRRLEINVLRELKGWIAGKEKGFGPGEVLASVSELARRLGASRPTVRKVLGRLAEERLIVGTGRKASVAYTANATVALEGLQGRRRKQKHPRDDEILECRRWLEAEAAVRAAGVARTSAAFRNELKRAFMEIVQGQRADGAQTALRKDRALHALLFTATLNNLESEIFHVARGYALDALAMSLLHLWVEEGFRNEVLRLNRALFEAVMRGDAVAARAAAEHYVDYVAKAYRGAKRESDRTP